VKLNRSQYLGAWIAVVLLSLAAIAACTQLGLTKPSTLDQRIAYAEGQVTAGYKSVADLANRGRITQTTGLKLIGDLDAAGSALKVARVSVANGKPDNAESALASATTLLLSVESKLKEAAK
jgi:hypothetical protein